MATPTQGPSGYYVWEVPGQPVVVQLRLDVVDRLAAEVVRAFGALPKRGAEVGGLLIGNTRPGLPTIVRIDDFEPVPCEYRRGPSYAFTEEDRGDFEDCWRRWQPSASPSSYAVGYFRSHTRDGLALAPEDLEIMDRLFPGAAHLALLIKPFATKVSAGGFFVRQHGVFPEATPLEFPLRRRELLGEEPAPRAPAEARMLGRKERPAPPPAANPEPNPPRAIRPAATQQGSRSGWVWLPLTFLFLLLGAALGYQFAITSGARAAAIAAQDFSLSLAIRQTGDNLTITWSRVTPAIRYAQRGVLEIADGVEAKPISLDAAQLSSGRLIYHNASKSVRLRLTVFPQAGVSVMETVEWKQ